jgi:Na+/H+ antiporter NhaD/arsenite permease-like protein
VDTKLVHFPFELLRLRTQSDAVTLPNPWMILPFALLLAAMAFASTLAPNWWLRHYPKVAVSLGAVTLFYYLVVLRDLPRVWHTVHDYISFIALAGSLFVVSGGIHIDVNGRASPLKNAVFLLIGALAANVLGTTGAAMVLVRPWIRMNRNRIAAHHIVFFIFIVANVGGCLTPIGDPPLFLGFLEGGPFWWITCNAWPMWALAVGFLLAIFYALDKANFARKHAFAETETAVGSWKFTGLTNLLFLAIILGAVFASRPIFLREGLMLAAALGSYFSTAKSIHAANNFNFHPLQEVAILFAGIFATMMPALDWLSIHSGKIAVSPGILFWSAGGLSAVLDNAPTYLSFLSELLGPTGAGTVAQLTTASPTSLLAISVGAVFFGAATYIGNAPNFMVKSIAGHEKAPAPGFLGYIWRFTLPFLLPALVVTWLLFFRS